MKFKGREVVPDSVEERLVKAVQLLQIDIDTLFRDRADLKEQIIELKDEITTLKEAQPTKNKKNNIGLVESPFPAYDCSAQPESKDPIF